MTTGNSTEYKCPDQRLTKREQEARDLTNMMHNGFLQCESLFLKKQLDYGPRNIGEFGTAGVLIRMNDKMARLKNLMLSGDTPQNESISDTLQDLCNYAMIMQLLMAGDWPDAANIRIRTIE